MYNELGFLFVPPLGSYAIIATEIAYEARKFMINSGLIGNPSPVSYDTGNEHALLQNGRCRSN